ACLAVRASAKTKPASVRVRDCDFTVGHMQVGALVLDASATAVSGNTLRVDTLPAALTVSALLADPARQGALVRQLVGRPARPEAGTAPSVSGFGTRLSAAGKTVAFDSPIPQSEWQALAANHPPTATQAQTSAGLQQWVQGLAAQAVTQPAALPSFQRHIQ